MKTLRPWPAAALLLLLLSSACIDLEVPDYNASSLQSLTTTPTPLAVATAAQGLIWGVREDYEYWVIIAASLGREAFNLSAADAGWRTILNTMNSGFYLTREWGNPYRNIRQANIVLGAVDAVTGMTDAEKNGVRGFTKTMQALDYLLIIESRDTAGAFVDVGRDPTGDPAPWASKAQVYTHIEALLDQAKVDLQAAGSTMVINVGPGMAPFTTPATFLKLNRGIRGRVAVYRDDWNTALTALSESFLDTNQPLTYGAYHVWSTNAGDKTFVRIFDPTGQWHYGHPTFKTDAKLRADGTRDRRFTSKTQAMPLKTFQNVGSDFRPTVYPRVDGQITMIRNEELILLRAEANLGAGNTDQALTDISFIRTSSGGLDAIPLATWQGMTSAQRLDELLYNKRYSLWFEGGHRWIDWRHYGKLAQLPIDRTGDKRFSYIQIPTGDCNVYNPKPAGCAIPAGF